jgi:hypothetical protein
VAAGGWSVGLEDRDPAPSRNAALSAAALTRPEPSWGRVLVNTVRLAVSWRLRAAGPGRRAGGPRPWRARWRAGVLVLALAGAAVTVVWLTGTQPRAARVPVPGAGPAAAAALARAAVWVAGQVSGSVIIACDPGMCAALQGQGVAAGRLMPLRSAAASPLGASVLVTTPSADGQQAGRYAPALIASFGSGDARVEVRVIEPGGAAAYRAALRADLAARMAAGAQLLQNPHIQFTGPDAAYLRAGQVDARLLATIAALASQYAFGVTAFGDAAPGAPVLFRAVSITGIGRGLAAALAMVRAQAPPYLPAHAAVTGPADASGATLSIEFAAPSPLGLLAPVLDADPLRPAGHGAYLWGGIR